MKLDLTAFCALLHTTTAVWIKEMESKYLRRKSQEYFIDNSLKHNVYLFKVISEKVY